MMRQYVAKSTFMGLITRGRFWSLLTPWEIEIDTERKRVQVNRRNWYLINKNEDTFQFSSVRHVKIDNSLFGADLHIRMYAGSAIVIGISKKSAKIIRELLLDGQFEQENRGRNRGGRKEIEIYNDYQDDDN